MRAVVALLSCAIGLGTALPARAELDEFEDLRSSEESSVARNRQSDPHTVATGSRWYGWQTLAFDAASVGSMAGGIYESEELFFAGFFGYVFGAPIVHGAHGESTKAVGSFAMRVALPIFGGLIAGAARECERDPGGDPDYDRNCNALGFDGVLIGAGLAIGLDAVFLAHDTPDETPPLPFAPSVAVAKDRATFSLGGTF